MSAGPRRTERSARCWLLEVFDAAVLDVPPGASRRHAVWMAREDTGSPGGQWRWWCCCFGPRLDGRADLVAVLTLARMHFYDHPGAIPVRHPSSAWSRASGEPARDDRAVADLARTILGVPDLVDETSVADTRPAPEDLGRN